MGGGGVVATGGLAVKNRLAVHVLATEPHAHAPAKAQAHAAPAAGALRSDFTSHRPAQPVLFLDGTSGSIGRGVSLGELGCADFKGVGDADTKQSRATLQPLFLYQV